MKSFFVVVLLFFAVCVNGQDTTQHVKAGYGVSVDQTQPEFPGGRDSLRMFLRKNVHYPAAARDSGIRGKVWLSFTVDKEGNIRDSSVIKKVSPPLDSAALDVLRSMPAWKPATRGGQNVDAQYLLQVEFIPPGQK